MWEKVKTHISSSEGVFFVFVKWVLIGGIIGLIVGLVGISFHWLLEKATEFRMDHPGIQWLLPIGGLAIIGSYHILGMQNDRGTNFILVAVRQNKAVSLKTAPLIFFSTIVTHLFGGSAGREGAALQLGGSLASFFGRIIKLNEKDERIITMCGMAAGFSALFGTPITAVIFSMEVISVGIMHYSAIVPGTIAAFVAAALAQRMGFLPTAYALYGVPDVLSYRVAISVAVLGILCALVSMLFCITMNKVFQFYSLHIKNQYVRIFVGGAVLIGLTFLLGCNDYNGAGMHIIQKAIQGEAKPEAFLLKIILTAITLGAGFKGGEIVPTFFVGATLGCVFGPILGLSPSFAAGLGMTAVFCGVTNCPIASFVLCIELFGAKGIIYYALCCGISYMLSGYYGLYSEQKIMYSKVKPEFIDRSVE
ncbi:chloride channel protein [Anaerotignum neopropionicum]|uniref:chloride channel protein n=1 Tax=Anaerotignum neopropionicum TaxID=36847 RepID=UPI001FA76B26|nr:chloride channel protein [Anaerotignum neopropionicum]